MPPPTQRLRRELGRNIVIEGGDRRRPLIMRVFATFCSLRCRRGVLRIRPIVVRLLTRCWDHRGHQHHEISRHALAYEWRDEATEGLRHQYEIRAASDRVDNGVGVLRQSGGVGVARQVHCDDLVASITELGFQKMPIPSAVTRTVNQYERRQASLLQLDQYMRPPLDPKLIARRATSSIRF